MRNPLKKPRITLNLNIQTNLSNHLPSFPLPTQHIRRAIIEPVSGKSNLLRQPLALIKYTVRAEKSRLL